MANENVKKFEELLRSDEALQKKLAEAAKAFNGDKTDEKAVFEATFAKLAEEAGLPLSYGDVRDYAAAEGELSDEDLADVAGGRGFCFIIGGSSETEVQCDNVGGYACAYVGITG